MNAPFAGLMCSTSVTTGEALAAMGLALVVAPPELAQGIASLIKVSGEYRDVGFAGSPTSGPTVWEQRTPGSSAATCCCAMTACR